MLELEKRDIDADRNAVTSRIEAFKDKEPQENPSLIIDPSNQNTHPSSQGTIPEVQKADLTADTLKQAIIEQGALIVRGFLPADRMESLKQLIDGVIDSCAERQSKKKEPPSLYYNPPNNLRSFMPGENQGEDLALTRQFLIRFGAAMCIESASAAEVLFDLYNELGLKNLVGQFLGEEPCVSAKKWVLRRATVPEFQPDWHQDGSFMGRDINSLNMWITLSHCGSDTGAPGMDIIPRRLYEIVTSNNAKYPWSLDDQIVSEKYGQESWVSPEFHPGDAIFFDHLSLHRTQYRNDLNKIRYAIETWFFGKSAFPKNQVPMAW